MWLSSHTHGTSQRLPSVLLRHTVIPLSTLLEQVNKKVTAAETQELRRSSYLRPSKKWSGATLSLAARIELGKLW